MRKLIAVPSDGAVGPAALMVVEVRIPKACQTDANVMSSVQSVNDDAVASGLNTYRCQPEGGTDTHDSSVDDLMH